MGEMAMKSEALGWLAAGVLALGLNGIYHDGGAAWLHRNADQVIAQVADRSGAVLALATGRADLFLAKAHVAAARNETASCRMAAAMARAQSKMERMHDGMADFEAMSAREEAGLARLEADRARIEAQVARVSYAAFDPVKVRVFCPRIQVAIPQVRIPAVNIPRIPAVHVAVPDVHVDVMGSEPI
jgi:hypothetical protein